MMSDFRSDDSFPVKPGSRPTAMVDPSFDAEYPTLPGSSRSQTRRVSTSGFIGEKPVENRKFMKMVVSMLKTKVFVDFLMSILGTIWFRPQLSVLSPKNR